MSSSHTKDYKRQISAQNKASVNNDSEPREPVAWGTPMWHGMVQNGDGFQKYTGDSRSVWQLGACPVCGPRGPQPLPS